MKIVVKNYSYKYKTLQELKSESQRKYYLLFSQLCPVFVTRLKKLSTCQLYLENYLSTLSTDKKCWQNRQKLAFRKARHIEAQNDNELWFMPLIQRILNTPGPTKRNVLYGTGLEAFFLFVCHYEIKCRLEPVWYTRKKRDTVDASSESLRRPNKATSAEETRPSSGRREKTRQSRKKRRKSSMKRYCYSSATYIAANWINHEVSISHHHRNGKLVNHAANFGSDIRSIKRWNTREENAQSWV